MDGPFSLSGTAATLHPQEGSSSSASRVSGENSPFLLGLLMSPLRLCIKDGRVVTGKFLCTDRDCNLILADCEQLLPGPDPSSLGAPINTGMMMVPGDEIVSISKEKVEGKWSGERGGMSQLEQDLADVSVGDGSAGRAE